MEEEEPEWFSAGPTSQSDTIELRGFEKEPEEDTGHGEGLIIEEEECGDEAPAESNDKTGMPRSYRNRIFANQRYSTNDWLIQNGFNQD